MLSVPFIEFSHINLSCALPVVAIAIAIGTYGCLSVTPSRLSIHYVHTVDWTERIHNFTQFRFGSIRNVIL